MNSYFKGWRRKCGVGVLLLACAAMAFWIRQANSDKLDFVVFRTSDQSIWLLASCPEGFAAEVQTELVDGTSLYKDKIGRMSFTLAATSQLYNEENTTLALNQWGFKAGKNLLATAASDIESHFWLIPSWFVTCLLTLLAASLLFSKTRTKTLSPTQADSSPASSA